MFIVQILEQILMIVHMKINYENKSYTATTKIDGKKEESSGSCYLTTACMKHFCDKFDDNCYELQVLLN